MFLQMNLGKKEKRMDSVPVGFQTELKCMREIIVKVVGMERLPVGGLMDKKCMYELIQTELDMERKQHGGRMDHQYN